MAWSTPQLAELANTTVNTIRHYHKLGLLSVPERGANGYKSYGVTHLVRLLQIKKLSELGVPLTQVAALVQAEEYPDEEIRALDADLEASMNRIAKARAELASILEHRASIDIPTGFAPVSRDLHPAQRTLLTVYSTVFSETALDDFRSAVAAPDDTNEAFENLPADADDTTVDLLARRLAPLARQTRDAHPGLADPLASSPHGAESAGSAMAEALVAVYNPAQLRVLKGMNDILTRQDEEERTGASNG